MSKRMRSKPRAKRPGAKRHIEGRRQGPDVVYTALQEVCPDCGRELTVYQNDGRRVQGLDDMFWMRRRDKRCHEDCPGERPIWYATRDIRVVLPQYIYGLDVTLYVGERHLLDGLSLAQIARDLNDRGLPLDRRQASRMFRAFVALTKLAAGDDAAVQQRLRDQGGMVLMCDGVQFEDRSPVLYIVWDAISGQPLFGERKAYRSEEDLVPILERVRAMDVPVIGIVTDKERGLVPAVKRVFPGVPYQYCQTHFLKNCAKPLAPDLAALQASVKRRADAVREIGKLLDEPTSARGDEVATALASATITDAAPSASTETSGDARAATAATAAAAQEADLVREVCEVVRVNSRVSGKAPLDPAELKRHGRLEEARSFVADARKKNSDGGHTEWPLFDRLHEALMPTWQETRTAGRVLRHTEIIRGVAHELSNAPDREDRPASASEAKRRFTAYLDNLTKTTPRAGLAAPTGAFIDDLMARAERYRDHLFVCFDDPRIPATTNSLEGFFGAVKGKLRRMLACGSTTNTVVTNLGAEALLAYQRVRSPGLRAIIRAPTASPAQFTAARTALREVEAPATKRRSMVRNIAKFLGELRDRWLGPSSP